MRSSLSAPRLNPSAIVAVTRKAVEEEGEYFVLVLEFYLKDKWEMGLELVAHDRRKFQKALSDLFGDETAARMGARIDSELQRLKSCPTARHQQG